MKSDFKSKEDSYFHFFKAQTYNFL